MRNIKAIIDADSMIYSASLSETLEGAKSNLDRAINSALNGLESEGCEVSSYVVCSGSKGNFRKAIYKDYKANRTQDTPEFLSELHRYCKTEWHSYFRFGVETDDLVASIWSRSLEDKDEHPVIVAIDKDYLQFPATVYNYNKKTLVTNTEIEALRAFYTQMIVGDSADNIKTCKGKGKAFATKLFNDKGTKYEFMRATFEVYKELYKSKARERFITTYLLLKLKTDVV